MNTWMKMVLVVGLLAGGMIATGTVAAADPIQDDAADAYRDAMWYFVPELGDWSTELQQTVEALPLKPELASDLDELAYRGEYMIYDLEATQPVPEMQDAHERLLFALRQLTEVAQIAVEDPAGAQLLLTDNIEWLDDARQDIRVWLMRDIGIKDMGKAPVVLVAGN